MPDNNKSQFWMFAFIIFIFFILMKHTIQTQKSNTVTRIICAPRPIATTCAQGVTVSTPSQNLIPIPATPPTPAPQSCLCCGTPAPIIRILSNYKQSGTIEPTCALTLCYYDQFVAKTPNATPCQKKVFAIVATEAASNFVSNTPISCVLKNFAGFTAGHV